jgi:hypothetical protein
MDVQLPKRCTLNACKRGLLDQDYNSINKEQKEHVRNVHRPWTEYIGFDGISFAFHRTTERGQCFCETAFTSPRSLRQHVLGTNSKPPSPCLIFIEKAREVARTRETFEDAGAKIHYKPEPKQTAGPSQNKLLAQAARTREC